MECAARSGDSETLDSIIEGRGNDEPFNKKDLNRILLLTVMSCNSTKRD